jgi:hypothetical protein
MPESKRSASTDRRGLRRRRGSLADHRRAARAQARDDYSCAHLSAHPLRAANDAVGAKIAAAMNRKPGAAASDEVVAPPPGLGRRTGSRALTHAVIRSIAADQQEPDMNTHKRRREVVSTLCVD